MSDAAYTVSDSEQTRHMFRAALESARAHGELAVAVRGAKWIMYELAHNPNEFGESREEASPLQLNMRIGFANPMFVIYGVHEPSRTVFVRKLGYSPRRA